LLLNKDNNGNRLLTEQKAAILDIAASKSNILPQTRQNIAQAIIEHYQEQASRLQTTGNRDEDGNYGYRVAPEMLEVVSHKNKRHLQIPKSVLQIKWDEENNQTLIAMPYAANPIKIPNINLIEKSDWNMLILHQESVESVNPMTPWVVDVKKTTQPYLLKLMDSKNPGRSRIFDQAKQRG
jgi:hypothetical protein